MAYGHPVYDALHLHSERLKCMRVTLRKLLTAFAGLQTADETLETLMAASNEVVKRSRILDTNASTQ